MTIDYFPRYQPKPQATTCSSVVKMILALQTKPNSYKPYLSQIGIVSMFLFLNKYPFLFSHSNINSLLFSSIKIHRGTTDRKL